MSEYWKSQPKKFCDICKCWFAGNKASIEFHEKGKKHQENVKRKVSELQHKGFQEAKAKASYDRKMRLIEEKALKAYEKDVSNEIATADPSILSKIRDSVRSQPSSSFASPSFSQTAAKKPAKKPNQTVESKIRTWFQAKSDEGHIYYWNTETGESSWEPPEEDFVTIKEQTADPVEDNKKACKISHDHSKHKEECETEGPWYGPELREGHPYGDWVTVREFDYNYDLQLPKTEDDDEEEVNEPIEELADEPVPEIKFKEKVISSLNYSDDEGEAVTFKKRKNAGNVKRNVRQRTSDD